MKDEMPEITPEMENFMSFLRDLGTLESAMDLHRNYVTKPQRMLTAMELLNFFKKKSAEEDMPYLIEEVENPKWANKFQFRVVVGEDGIYFNADELNALAKIISESEGQVSISIGGHNPDEIGFMITVHDFYTQVK